MSSFRRLVGPSFEHASSLKDSSVRDLTITGADFVQSLRRTRPSPAIPQSAYLTWNDKFGSN